MPGLVWVWVWMSVAARLLLQSNELVTPADINLTPRRGRLKDREQSRAMDRGLKMCGVQGITQ